ncbi:pickpocket protein 28-like [Contarinia nasturtii]|uniref:pickpocket protein 28-like n=1 Tax=Contarinia nasturtii TaxID=265458 RepID=UPI0012D38DBA|nr:pickpocket protein 28-like [Contarinia nasturtii]
MYTDAVVNGFKTVTNNPNITHWSLDNGYQSERNENEYPYRTFGTHAYGILDFILEHLKEDVNIDCNYLVGFGVYFTHPGDSIKTLGQAHHIQTLKFNKIKIKPKLVITSSDLRDHSPIQRQCFFENERKLRFYKMYTQNNCELECLANFTRIECECVKFSMPRDAETRICGVYGLKCLRNAGLNLFGIELIAGIKNRTVKQFREKCNCKPACTRIEYNFDVEQSGDISDAESFVSTTLEIVFKEAFFTTLQRSPLYTFTDFLAICGGLLGLFLGVSLLSIIEFVYYFSLRLIWTLRRSQAANVVAPVPSPLPSRKSTPNPVQHFQWHSR